LYALCFVLVCCMGLPLHAAQGVLL
jgi:hypothetical protein